MEYQDRLKTMDPFYWVDEESNRVRHLPCKEILSAEFNHYYAFSLVTMEAPHMRALTANLQFFAMFYN